jgi:hypothetical protein
MKHKVCLLVLLLYVTPLRADVRSTLAREVAEATVARFGAKAASKGVPALAAKIEAYAAKYGDDAFNAIRRVGPRTFQIVDGAGANGAKAMRVLALHGEAGATCVLNRPAAMAQFLRFGEEGAAVLVKHPGIAERVVERAGLPAVKAMAAVGPQNGRRIAMMMEGELGQMPRSVEILDVIARYGDRAAVFVWENKGALTVGTALTAFLLQPEPFIDGTRDITKAAGEAVLRPLAEVPGEAVKGVVAGTNWTVIIILVLAVAVLFVLVYRQHWLTGVSTTNTSLQVAKPVSETPSREGK